MMLALDAICAAEKADHQNESLAKLNMQYIQKMRLYI